MQNSIRAKAKFIQVLFLVFFIASSWIVTHQFELFGNQLIHFSVNIIDCVLLLKLQNTDSVISSNLQTADVFFLDFVFDQLGMDFCFEHELSLDFFEMISIELLFDWFLFTVEPLFNFSSNFDDLAILDHILR